MARPVPADLEDALAATPAARDRFWALPPEQKDAWVGYVARGRFPGARRRRVSQTVRRLGGVEETVARQNGALALPRESWSAWLVGLALLAGLAAFLVWLTVYRGDGGSARPSAVVVAERTPVPKVTGIRYQAAEFQLRDAKLRSTVTRRNAARPKGIVVAQTPKHGTSVPQGTEVALVVSKGPAGVAMPDLTGMAAADAVKALQKRKLVATLEQTPSKQAPGTVLAQDPKPGKRAKPGTKVTLQVSKGRPSVDVPDLVGETRQDALATLRKAGLAANVVEVPSSQPAGAVVAQSPAAGAAAAQGSPVRLNVSAGPRQAPGPAPTTTAATATAPRPKGNDYTGMRLDAAARQIAAGRQQAIVEYVPSSQPAGVVVSNAREGGKERLRVSAGPNPAREREVPDTSGEDASTAQQDVRSAGFTVIQVSWPVSDESSDGVVVYQTPDAGGSVPEGSAVVLYVGSTSGG
jgi:beta-lactam-binding protein with PASTA domain